MDFHDRRTGQISDPGEEAPVKPKMFMYEDYTGPTTTWRLKQTPRGDSIWEKEPEQERLF